MYMYMYHIIPLHAAGVDYHFYKEDLYVTLSSGIILHYNLSVSETEAGTLSIEANPPSTTVYVADAGNDLGSITVDWLNDTIYWIEYEGTETKVGGTICNCTCSYISYLHVHVLVLT